MAIQTHPANLSVLEPTLGGLAGRSYDKSYVPVPNSHLPRATYKVLQVVYEALSGKPLEPETASLAVSSDSGSFKRLYTPKLHSNDEGQAYIRWGDERLLLATDGDKLAPVASSPGNARVSFGFTTFNPSGRGEDPGLAIKVSVPGTDKDTDVYTVTVALAPKDWKSYSSEYFNSVLENDLPALAELLTGEPTSTGSATQGETTDVKSIVAKVFGKAEHQTRPLSFTITGYRVVKASYGDTFVLQSQPAEDADVRSCVPFTEQPFGIWAPAGGCKAVLAAQPSITPELPATLTVYPGQAARLVLAAGSTTQIDGVDLNF